MNYLWNRVWMGDAFSVPFILSWKNIFNQWSINISAKKLIVIFVTQNKSWLNKTLKRDCSVTLPLTSHTTPPLPPPPTRLALLSARLHTSKADPHPALQKKSKSVRVRVRVRVRHSRRFDPCTLWFEVSPGIPSSTQTQTWLSQAAPSPPSIKNLVDATWYGRYAQLKLTAEMFRKGIKITLGGKERLHSDLFVL